MVTHKGKKQNKTRYCNLHISPIWLSQCVIQLPYEKGKEGGRYAHCQNPPICHFRVCTSVSTVSIIGKYKEGISSTKMHSYVVKKFYSIAIRWMAGLQSGASFTWVQAVHRPLRRSAAAVASTQPRWRQSLSLTSTTMNRSRSTNTLKTTIRFESLKRP